MGTVAPIWALKLRKFTNKTWCPKKLKCGQNCKICADFKQVGMPDKN